MESTAAAAVPRISDRHFRSLIENASDLIAVVDADARVHYVSPSVRHILGYEPDLILGAVAFGFVHPDDYQAVAGAFEEAKATPGTRPAIEFRAVDAGGNWRWFQLVMSNHLEDPAIGGVVVNVFDVTDHRRAEAALHAQQESFRLLVEGAKDFVSCRYRVRPSPCLEHISAGVEPMTGYTAAEFEADPELVLRRCHQDDRAGLRAAMRDGDRMTDPHLARWFRKDGAMIWVELRVAPVYDETGQIAALEGVAHDVTDRVQAEQAVIESEQRWRTLLRNSSDVVTVIDAEGKVAFSTPSENDLFGYPSLDVTGMVADSFVHPDDVEQAAEFLDRVMKGTGESEAVEIRIRDASGETRWAEAVATNLLDDPLVAGIVVNTRDITARKAVEDELRKSEERFRALVQRGSDVILVISNDNTIGYVSPSVETVFGYRPDEVGPRGVHSLLHPDDVGPAFTTLAGILDKPGATTRVECRVRHKDGSWRQAEAVGTNLLHDPAVGGFLLNIRDITQRKQAEDRLAHLALHDPLTGLPNRSLFIDRLGQAVGRLARSHAVAAVFFLDLDNFKIVNDSLGHAAGDTVLKAVAGRLQAELREGDTAARLGGDEFAILCGDLDDEREAMTIAERVLAALASEPVAIGPRQVTVTASIGVALANRRKPYPEDLLRDADAAMYRAKERGRNRYELFGETMRSRALTRLETESALRVAFEREQLEVHYQPQVALPSGTVTAVEALVRWRRPGHGIVSADAFMDLADEAGLSVSIGTWVLRKACEQLVAWNEAGVHLTMTVNVCGRQLADPRLVTIVDEVLQETGADPASLSLEITEGVLMDDVEVTRQVLARLRGLGVGLAIDDFGTGYSSLAYLRGFPVDSLKIDRSLVVGLGLDSTTDAIVWAVLSLARAVGLSVVAEGIEAAVQLQTLRFFGCDVGQGYWFAPAVPAADVETLLSRRW